MPQISDLRNLPSIILALTGIYTLVLRDMTFALILFAAAGFSLALYQLTRGFTELDQEDNALINAVARLAAIWLLSVLQFLPPVLWSTWDSGGILLALFEVVSAITTSGMGATLAQQPHGAPLSLLLTLCAGYGGYLAIYTGYIFLRSILYGGPTASWFAEEHTLDAGLSQKSKDIHYRTASVVSPASRRQYSTVSSLQLTYGLAVLVLAANLSSAGLPPMLALHWSIHAIATAGPLPELASYTGSAPLPAETSILLMLGMAFGSLVIPLMVLSRVLPRVISPALMLWLIMVVFAFSCVTLADQNALSWQDWLTICLSLALTGPNIMPSMVEISIPLLAIAAIGPLPCGTGGGIGAVNARETFEWMRDDVESLGVKPRQYKLSRYEVTRSRGAETANRAGLSFLLGCQLLVSAGVLLSLSLEANSFAQALGYTVSALSNAGGVLTQMEGGGGEAIMQSDLSIVALIVGMLAGRIDLLIPAFIAMVATLDSKWRRSARRR